MRLYIYDEGEPRHGRHDENEGISGVIQSLSTIKLPAKDVAALHSGLARLLNDGKTFNRVLVMTHGGPGRVTTGGHGL